MRGGVQTIRLNPSPFFMSKNIYNKRCSELKKYGGTLLKNGIVFHYESNYTPHCDNGPAVVNITDQYYAYYRHGKRHREDGPAIMGVVDDNEWWYYGIQAATETEFNDPDWRKDVIIRVLI